MKLAKALLVSAILAGTAGPAKADGFGLGLILGSLIAAPIIASTYYPPYYYRPYYSYAPAPVYYPPPAYVQPMYSQPAYAPAPPQPAPQTFNLYFCPSAKAYYPYVATCPGGWQVI